jgi:uncharacterized phage-associated protein
MSTFDYKKTVQTLTYFAKLEGGRLNKMKALKLIWLSDRLNLRKYARTITGDSYFALNRGPVASATRDILEDSAFLEDFATVYSKDFIEIKTKFAFDAIAEPDTELLSQSDIETLNLIYQSYGKLDQFQLSDLSHNFPEWKKYEQALKQRTASRYEINQDDFFENFDDGKGLFIDTEQSLDISKKMFEQRCSTSLSSFR